MKAWRFYGFNDMRLDKVPDPVRRDGHVIAEILCVQPSVTEAQLAYGIPTLAYEQIKHRLATEAPIRFIRARVLRSNRGVRWGFTIPSGRSCGSPRQAALRRMLPLPIRAWERLPAGSDYRFSVARLLLRVRCPTRNRFDEGGRPNF